MKELLFSITKKDFTITWFSGRGAGGQHRNKHQNCCRIKHNETGLMSTGQSHRTRPANQREAFTGLTKSLPFRIWLNRKAYEASSNSDELNYFIDQQLREPNILIEYGVSND